MFIFSQSTSAAIFTVTNLNDSGIGSLRQALLNANNAPGAGANTILFQSGLSGKLLTVGNFSINGKLDLIGPGAGTLTLFGNGVTLFTVGGNATVTISGLTLTNGRNGIDNAGTLTVNNSILSANVASGIYNHGANAVLAVNNSTLSDNAASGIYNRYGGTVTVNHSTLSGNQESGIYNCGRSGGTVTVNHSTLSANKREYGGGGICSDGTLTISNSTLSDNSVTADYSGGGIYSSGLTATITHNTFFRNAARSSCGGGIYITGAATVAFHNNTLSENVAKWGGGLCVDGNFVFKMVNNTLSGNIASAGSGGIYIDDNTLLSIGNSVVAGNTAPTAREIGNYGTFVSDGHNLFGVNGVSGLVNASPVASDIILPGLISTAIGPLVNNGGPTLTYLPGSLMIDAGDSTLVPVGVTTDQRGYVSRIMGSAVDIGAVEAGALPPDQVLIEHYYQAILGRTADINGLASWRNEAARASGLGLDIKDVFRVMAGLFFTSAEYLNRNTSDAQYITDLYRTFFKREPDSSGLAFWTQPLTAGLPRSVVLFSFLFSTEFGVAMQNLFGTTTARSETATVGDFYRGFLNRLPDDAGFAFWLGRFRVAQCTSAAAVGVEVESISSQFLASAEYTSRQRSDRDFVADLYYVFLRRDGDLIGFNYWVNQLSSSTRDQVRQAFVNASEFQTRVSQIIGQGCAP